MNIVVRLTSRCVSYLFSMYCDCIVIVLVIDFVYYHHHRNDSTHAYTIAFVIYLVYVYWSTYWCRRQYVLHCYYHLTHNLTSCWYAIRLVVCLGYSHFHNYYYCCCCNDGAISNTTISSLIRFSLLSIVVIVMVIVICFYHWYYHCHYCWSYHQVVLIKQIVSSLGWGIISIVIKMVVNNLYFDFGSMLVINYFLVYAQINGWMTWVGYFHLLECFVIFVTVVV